MQRVVFCNKVVNLEEVLRLLQEYPLVAMQDGERVKIYVTSGSVFGTKLEDANGRGIIREESSERNHLKQRKLASRCLL